VRVSYGVHMADDLFGERLKCGTAEIERPKRSERETLPAIATTDLFGLVLIVSLDPQGIGNEHIDGIKLV
jgi:hypothetical protein